VVPRSADPLIRLRVNGADVELADDGSTLLEVLRERLALRSLKDGCSPQGQCGCCTVWVDGAPRVACVTPVRRLDGKAVTTLEGLPEPQRQAWADALVGTGGSQCGFCTPGIVMRLAALASSAPATDREVDQALLAHLCRCTGWRTVVEAARQVSGDGAGFADRPGGADRDLATASARATIEGGVPQRVDPGVVLGDAGFADDSCPTGALVAVVDGDGYAVADTLSAARAVAGKVQGRSTTVPLAHPVDVPDGEWTVTLATTWVEPAYLEPDASWCEPGGEPASPYGNGGSFGGKLHSPVAADARRLADLHGRTVRVLWSREDVVRRGPKRPPVAAGITGDGTGILRVGVSGGPVAGAPWDALVADVAAVAPGLVLEQVPVHGPPVSLDLRGAVWAEAAVLAAAARLGRPGVPVFDVPVEAVTPGGGRAVARCGADGSLAVDVAAGAVLDAVALRSYAIGAAHQALGWVRSEGIAVDADGAVQDLTVRSFGILQARAVPDIAVRIVDQPTAPPVNGSDAVFAAVAAARWLGDGLVPRWPTDRAGVGRR
jgi:aerobic-type carbon monoxide dehydrogenase small subunit (CoxS/CutS family)